MLLVITLPDQTSFSAAETVAHWCLFDAKSNLLREGRDLLQNMPRAEQVIATVPISRIAFIETPLPRVSGARREALLRYAIEDKLTIDPDTIHVVLMGEADATHAETATRYIVTAIDRRWFTAALRWLDNAQLKASAVFAETELITVAPDEWAVVLGAQHSYAKRHDGFAYVLDSIGSSGVSNNEPPFALTLALSEVAKNAVTKPPATLAIYTAGDMSNHSADSAMTANWQTKLGIPARMMGNIDVAQTGKRLLQLKNGNLLTSEFKPSSAGSTWVRVLAPAFYLLALLIGLQLLFNVADWWRLDHQCIVLDRDMRQLFQTTFPKATAIVDPALQLTRNLETLKRERGLSIESDPRLALAQLVAITRSAPDLVMGDITIDENTATLLAHMNNSAATDQLRQKVAAIPRATMTILPPTDNDNMQGTKGTKDTKGADKNGTDTAAIAIKIMIALTSKASAQ